MKGIVILLVGLSILLTLSVLWSALRDAWIKRRRRQGADSGTLHIGDIGDGGGDEFGAGDGGNFGGFEF